MTASDTRTEGPLVVQSSMAPSEALYKFSLCVGYIVVSATLIRFNKYLMTPDRFPYSMFLTACHMTMSIILCSVFYLFRPSAFPGLASCESTAKKLLVVKWMMPIGVAFAVSLFSSNQAYIYCNVTFLQFMKEGNVIVVFLMSVALGLQSINRLKMAVIVWIIAGSSLAVRGEMHFVMVGFVFQLVSQVAECAKAVMGEMVLGGAGLKLDQFSYTLFVAPTCLAVLIVGNMAAWDTAIPQAMAAWWPYLLPNSMLAFVLNILVASIIKEISAVGFILAGVCKDMVIVLFSAVAFAEPVTFPQVVGFSVTLGGVFFWSYLKNYPDSEVAQRAASLLGMPAEKAPTEHTPLVPNSSKV